MRPGQSLWSVIGGTDGAAIARDMVVVTPTKPPGRRPAWAHWMVSVSGCCASGLLASACTVGAEDFLATATAAAQALAELDQAIAGGTMTREGRKAKWSTSLRMSSAT